MVLLKNDGNLLPLDKGKIKSIAVIGPDAHPAPARRRWQRSGPARSRRSASCKGSPTTWAADAKVYYAAGLPTWMEMAGKPISPPKPTEARRV